ncbi:carbohydrate kinase [Kineosporia sp. NBRC 101731]|uniref:carbohydrate kinase family protein n=1 Tax=Kineosporia sp. NBRC 101731 TaxID=3032199 RepID=UPI0024A47329|nr:carbohydrate kinase [Kineosporia sp. NBRC 101731]GLY28601.1 ribokinase [Kineosporia sp. NBRC 101731]
MDEVLVIGEALVDIVHAPGRPPVEHPGGSPANVALGLARLGVGTRLLTRIGDDARGRSIVDHLRGSGVELAEGSITPDATSTATARLDAEGVASYDFALRWALSDIVVSSGTRAIHTGSIAATLSPGGEDVLRLVEENAGRAVISYDPNARPALMGSREAARERIERIVRAADVVKVSDEDLEWLTPGADPMQVIEAWRASGPALVVLTRGGEGAVGVTATGVVEVAAPKITVADTVGAGDSLMSGLLHGLDRAGLLHPATIGQLRTQPAENLVPLLAHAVKIAAYTCTQAGAQPPTLKELDAYRP